MGTGLHSAGLRWCYIELVKLNWKWKDGVVDRIICKIKSTNTARIVDGHATVPRISEVVESDED